MTWEVLRRAAAAVLCAGLAATAGCSADRPGSSAEPAPARPATTPARPATAATTPSLAPSSPAPTVPTPGSTAKPATSSGPLSGASFPKPRRLGAGWRYAVDPGDPEEGYAGNGTPTLARNPQEIVQTAVPFGCPRRAAMPAPTHALEVDYTLHGRKVIAVRGSFGATRAAALFFDGRAENLRACTGRAASAAIGPLVTAVRARSKVALSSRRTPKSDPWQELSVLDRDSVVLVAAQGSDVLSDRTMTRLVRLLHS
ncbi:MAG: hypothetical protein QOF53_159 [Nocardioidaceae bacterium]|nr:hypothetical protein [Nocardioidaceae bacterium]